MPELISKAAVLKIIFDSIGKPATEIYQKVRELPEAGRGWIEASALLPPVEREERDEEDTTTTKVSVPVLGHCIGGEIRIVRRIDEESDEPGDYEWHGWTREPDDGCVEAVTHWMPLPQGPRPYSPESGAAP